MVVFFSGDVMELVAITLISIGLTMDAFAVSLGVGTAGQIPTLRGKIRLAAHFGIFQAGMTALGWSEKRLVMRLPSPSSWLSGKTILRSARA
jgi:putative Mn2+ efflux pump MntP